jgi:hypothetical protein
MRPTPEVELVLWVGAASEVSLGPNNMFAVRERAGVVPKPVWGQISFQLEEERAYPRRQTYVVATAEIRPPCLCRL